MNGIINFFKPRGMSSHQAVNFLRKKLDIRRIGHTGTLDPNVAGVLPLCIGKATRVSEYLLESDKEYICELTLGVRTSTFDSDGEVLASSNKQVLEEDIIRIFSKYIGDIDQVPPMYSALKYKGRKLYDLAREGIEVERKPRRVTIYENEIIRITGNKVLFRIKCSKGTYIRTICDDIGFELGSYGYMSYLIRTKSDIFNIEDSLGRESIEKMSLEEFEKNLISMDQGVLKLASLELDSRNYEKLLHGVEISLDASYENYSRDESYRVYCKNIFIGVGIIKKKEDNLYLKMKKVLLA